MANPNHQHRTKFRISVRLVAIILGIVGFIIGIEKEVLNGLTLEKSIIDFFLNTGNDFFGIAITVLVIDWLNEKNEEGYQKERLIRELGSKDNGIVLRAVVDLDAHGWLIDGSLDNVILIEANLAGIALNKARLKGASLEKSNLDGANLVEVDLQGANLTEAHLKKLFAKNVYFQNANLWRANLSSAVLEGVNFNNAILWQTNFQGAFLNDCCLEGADLRSSNLNGINVSEEINFHSLSQLCGATMPNGKRYDGSLNLKGDLEEVKKRGINLDDPSAMSSFYGITLEEYLIGQQHMMNN